MKKAIFEIKKNTSPTFIIMLVAFTLLFNSINIFKSYAPRLSLEDDKNILKGKTGIYSTVSGELTKEKYEGFYKKFHEVSKCVDSGDFSTSQADFDKYFSGYAFCEKYLYIEISDELERQLLYNEKIKDLKKEAAENAEFFKDINEYNYKQNRLILEKYGSRVINSFYYTSPISELFKYNFSSVLILLCMLFIITPMFSSERENDMLSLLKSTRYGYLRRGVALDKMKSIFIFISLLTLLFGIDDFLCMKISLKFSGIFQPLYVIEEFGDTPLTVSIFTFWLITLLLKWLGFLCIGSLMLLISKFNSTAFVGYILSVLAVAALMIFKAKGVYGFFDNANMFNPISLLISYKSFQKYDTVRFVNTPILRITVQTVSGILTYIVLSVALYFSPLENNILKGGIK